MTKPETCYAFDLDGTLTGSELLPRIAADLGISEEMAYLTRLTMDGLLDFEQSFRLRCACLMAAPIERVRAIVASTDVDPRLEAFVSAHRERCAIVTGNLDVWIAPLVERFGCPVFSSRAHVVDGRLAGVSSVLNKAHAVMELKERFATVVAIGDGVNDVPMFEVADYAVACGTLHPPAERLIPLADYVVFDGGALCRLLATL